MMHSLSSRGVTGIPRLVLPEGTWIHRGDYTLATLPPPSNLVTGETLRVTESGSAYGLNHDAGDIILVIGTVYRVVGFEVLNGGTF
jgi:hypothetical protein